MANKRTCKCAVPGFNDTDRCQVCGGLVTDQQRVDFINDNPPAEPKPVLYWVAIYDVNRAYGGPEEGGWWYDTGDLVIDPDIYGELMPMAFTEEDRAITYVNKMKLKATAANLAEGRRDKGSVASTGQYEAQIHEGFLAQHYPASRPRYE